MMAAMVAGSILLGALTRMSYRHDVEDVAKSPKTKILYHQKGSLEDKKGENDGLKETLLKADIIVRAEPAGPEQYQYEALLVPLRVKQVFKGDIKVNDLIDFYETSFFSGGKERIDAFYNVSIFNPMRQGKEYIVFANKREFHPAYQARLERDVYRPVSLEASYFLPEITEPPILDESEPLYYQEIKDNEFNCYSKEQRDAINRVKKEILSSLHVL